MGIGKCCCLSGSYRIRSFFGKSALDWDLFSSSDIAEGQSPIDMDFSMTNSKFYSGGFSYKKELNLGEFLYDICADNKYVYVAAGDLGVKVLKETNGNLSLFKTINPFSPRTSSKKHGSLYIGSSRGSLYGYETNPFNGVYSVCPAEKDGKILAACGKDGVKIIDVDSGSVSSVTSKFGDDFDDTICNKIIKDGNFVFLGSTGWTKWPSEDMARNQVFHYNKEYDDRGDYPDSIFPAGISVNTLNSKGIWGEDPYIYPGRTLGVNDISIKQEPFAPSGSTPIVTTNSKNKALIISYGREWMARGTGVGESYRMYFQGGIDIIGYSEKNSDGETEFVENYIKKAWGSENYDMPVMTASSGRGDHVFAFPGLSKKVGNGGLFEGDNYTDGAYIEHYILAKEDPDFTNGQPTDPESGGQTSYDRAFVFHNCVDTKISETIGISSSFVFNPYTQSVELNLNGHDGSSVVDARNRLKLPFEVFTSDINHQKNIKVTCVKGMGLMIEDTKPDSNGNTRADVFFGLTTQESFPRDPDNCEDAWDGENPRDKYWKDMTTGFFGSNPKNGFSNVDHTMSPVKSFIHKDKVYVIDSNMVIKNECGPGYLSMFNIGLMHEGPFASCWFSENPHGKNRNSGVIVLKKDSKIT